MIDWHSHILPNMDDGSKSVQESIALLESLAAQGVDTVVATPHFYANDERVSSFVERRQIAREKLCDFAPKCSVNVLMGAEVSYYSGVSRLDDLRLLKFQDSKILLLEMPMSKWSNYAISELIEISSSGEFTVLIAHIDRYMEFQSTKTLEYLLESGILMQANASFFNDFFKKHKALKLLGEGFIHVIGSDCHNIKSRPPKIGSAYEIIQKKFGNHYVNSINDFGKQLLCE